MITPIVAGADGSEESLAATAWAAFAAAQRRAPLLIVHVVEQEPGLRAHTHLSGHDQASRFGHDLPHHARSVLAKATRRAYWAAPSVDLRAVAVYGHAGQVLTAITARASLIAVGASGTPGSPGPQQGSVALHLPSHARCPVVFVPAVSAPIFHEIVVGTDGSDDAAAALEFGFGEADTRHAKLTALHIWALPYIARIERYPNWMLSVGPANPVAATSLTAQVAPWRQKYPHVLVSESTVHGQPGRVLTAFSGHADLVVTVAGQVRLGLAPGPDSGSAEGALFHHAQCPVAVIPCSLRPAPEADRSALAAA